MSSNTLLISDLILKERSVVHTSLDPKLIYPDIKYCQDLYIKPIFGTALFEKMQAIVADGTITSNPANVDYKYLVDTYLIDALIYFTLSELALSSSYQLTNKGMIRKIGDNTEMPTMSEIYTAAQSYKNRAEYYANRMKLFLIDQSSRLNKYPEYRLPGSTIDTVVPEMKSFSMPIYLGDSDGRDNPWCNPGGFNGQPYKD